MSDGNLLLTLRQINICLGLYESENLNDCLVQEIPEHRLEGIESTLRTISGQHTTKNSKEASVSGLEAFQHSMNHPDTDDLRELRRFIQESGI